jgi:hypothetical protein
MLQHAKDRKLYQNWRSKRAQVQPDRHMLPCAAEAYEALRHELSLNDFGGIAGYLGAAGEGLNQDHVAFAVRTELPLKYGEALYASDEKLRAPHLLDEASQRSDSER